MTYKRLVSYFKLLRISEWYGKVAIITAIALSFGTEQYNISTVIAIYFINFFNNAFAFGINDVEDAQDDALDPKKINRNPISAGLIGKNQSHLVVFTAATLCLIIATTFNLYTAAFCLLTLTVGFLYSYKPIRLKSIPILDILSHGFFLGLAQFIIPAIALNFPITLSFIFVGLMIFTSSLFGDLYNEIRDYEVDRKTNIRNTISIIDLRQYESVIHIFHIFALVAILLTSLGNLDIGHRTPIVIILTTIFIIATLLPKNIKKNFLTYSLYTESLMTLTSLLLLLLTI